MNPFNPLFPIWMPRDSAHGVHQWTLRVDLPSAMCPVSYNPRPGSFVTLVLLSTKGYPEVFAVHGCAKQAAEELIGGFEGDECRPGVRDMEGAVAHIVRAVADLFECPVAYYAQLELAVEDDVTQMQLFGTLVPGGHHDVSL